jgi:hypothetical protein
MRALHVLDRELVGLGKREEVPRRFVEPVLELGGDARAGQVEEADVVRRRTQVVAEGRGGFKPRVESGEVEDGQREISHAPTISAGGRVRPYVASGYRLRARRRFDRHTEAGYRCEVRVT